GNSARGYLACAGGTAGPGSTYCARRSINSAFLIEVCGARKPNELTPVHGSRTSRWGIRPSRPKSANPLAKVSVHAPDLERARYEADRLHAGAELLQLSRFLAPPGDHPRLHDGALFPADRAH